MIDRRYKALEDLRDMLKEAGFTDVRVQSVSPPHHVLDALQKAYGDDECITPEFVAAEIPYFAVETAEGHLWCMGGDFPMIDRKASGLSVREIDTQEYEDLPVDFPLIDCDGELLHKVCALMVERKRRRKLILAGLLVTIVIAAIFSIFWWLR